jgi:glycosyltransferase involved in cell wall biosynthesis
MFLLAAIPKRGAMISNSKGENLILFLQFSAGGQRGGELYTNRLHTFLKRKFVYVEPQELQPRPPEFRSIVRHAMASLRQVKSKYPSLLICDVSSGARNILAARTAKRHGSKLLVIAQERRTSYRFKSVFSKWLIHHCEDYLFGLADIVLVNSLYIADYAAGRISRRANIIICYPGLEIACERTSSNRLSSTGPNRHLNLLAVGEFTEPRKGMKYLLEALALLSDLNLTLHLAGGYSENKSHLLLLKRIIDRNNLGGRVIFHGFLDRRNLSELYQNSDIFILPSLSEGYGIALAEALTFGLPVVASNVAAIPEMVKDGVNALLVRPKDPPALASAIRRLAADQSLRDRMRENNLARAATLPTWSDFDTTLDRELVPMIEKITGLKAK